MSADQKRIVIIGAGFAGAACAWWLAQKGAKNVVVLEREEMPGLHASGLNAGMARRFEEDEDIAPLASEGIDFILNPPAGFCDVRLIECNGSLLLNPLLIPPLKKGGMGGFFKVLKKEDAIQKVPLLSDAKFDNALWTPTDGVIDINAYLWAFINGAKAGGVKFVMNAKIRAFEVKDNKISAVITPPFEKGGKGGIYKANIVINAAGAWAPVIGAMAGAEDLKIRSYRRHLYCTPPMPEVDPKWPFVWDIENQYYFRPESGGLLLGPADEEESPPCVPQTNPRIKEVLAEKLMKFCPSLSGVAIAREWCGLRTFTPDRKPLIRWDKKLKNFFWLTAIGGRGVTCAASAGRVAASVILSEAKDPAKR